MLAFRDWWGRDVLADDAAAAGVERLLADDATEFLLASPDDRAPAGVCQLRYRYGWWYDAPDCWLEDVFVTEDARVARARPCARRGRYRARAGTRLPPGPARRQRGQRRGPGALPQPRLRLDAGPARREPAHDALDRSGLSHSSSGSTEAASASDSGLVGGSPGLWRFQAARPRGSSARSVRGRRATASSRRRRPAGRTTAPPRA